MAKAAALSPSVESPKITLIGVGLLGGSVGLAAKKRGVAGCVAGLVRRSESIDECLAIGAVDEATQDLAKAVEGASLVILCTPVGGMKDMANQIKPHLSPEAVVTDVGSVKASVVQGVEPILPRFVGSHPLCGSEKTGVAHADADLFEGATCAVTPTEQSDAEAVVKVNEFWDVLGAKVVNLTTEAHDNIVARTSHLPHVVASALVNAILGKPVAGESDFIGTGFTDTTRLASGSPMMWRDIALTNSEAIQKAINDLQLELSELKNALDAKDGPALENFFKEGKILRDQWLEGGEKK